jgi:hypothetical protein
VKRGQSGEYVQHAPQALQGECESNETSKNAAEFEATKPPSGESGSETFVARKPLLKRARDTR